jgi:hypothetical protein
LIINLLKESRCNINQLDRFKNDEKAGGLWQKFIFRLNMESKSRMTRSNSVKEDLTQGMKQFRKPQIKRSRSEMTLKEPFNDPKKLKAAKCSNILPFNQIGEPDQDAHNVKRVVTWLILRVIV